MPDMGDARWHENLDQALALGIPHISSYALTVEPNTALQKFIEKGVVKPVDDAIAQRHFEILLATIAGANLSRSKPGPLVNSEIAFRSPKSSVAMTWAILRASKPSIPGST